MRRGLIRWFFILGVVFALVVIVESRKKPKKYVAFENLVNQLWDMDENRFEEGKDMILNVQGYVNQLLEDNAPEPLFVFVNETRLYETPTYRAFINLMKFHDPNVLNVEPSSPEKTQAQMKFLDAVMNTKVMKAVLQYLVGMNITTSNESEFKELLGTIWFTGFMRKKRMSSSPFEHVFLGEGSGTRTMGFHYWLPLYLYERLEALNYYGLHSKRRGGLKNVLSLAFKWRNDWMKSYGMYIFGTSPEFDLGVYTAAFMTMQSIWPTGYRFALPLKLKNTRLTVQCYRLDRALLGTCFIV
ncbi:hypothetical protein Aperf_G00000122895 [Anoplocephala perfoliata]